MSELNKKMNLLKLKFSQTNKQERPMFNSQRYGKWQAMLMQLSQSRLTNLVLLSVGIFESRSVYLSVLARKILIRAKKLSLAKRFERFLDNKAVCVKEWQLLSSYLENRISYGI